MHHNDDVSRRIFLERLAAAALLGAAGASNKPALAQSGSGGWTPPPVLKNPNILIVMVDQMRPPMWMNSSQLASLQTVLPNIMGVIQNNSYNFEQFYVSATQCTASRAGLLTGLYAPQTAMYANTGEGSGNAPALDTAFPTWGDALPALNPAYHASNVWWFGKWHLSTVESTSPLQDYGFQTRTYPGGTVDDPDPYGVVNEGSDGTNFNNQVWASDLMIANDFAAWLKGQSASPWCATVSLINPHDICYAPAWLVPPIPPVPTGVAAQQVYFPPPSNSQTPPLFYPSQTVPSPWNFENLSGVPNKPSMQYSFLTGLNESFGTISGNNAWNLYLNQYLWLQYLVDTEVGVVLSALSASAFSNNTIVIFLSDHGEYGGSHGLRTKGYAAYDESIRAPFYVQFPGQTGSIAMNQMFSGVDFFGLICDLATGGSGQWRLAYPDLANRQSVWSFLYNNSNETRIAPSPIGLPYIFHTFDAAGTGSGNNHIVCMRTKNTAGTGAKLSFYAEWAPCTTYPDATPLQWEFYNYNPTAAYPTTGNTGELGNDYSSSNPTLVQTEYMEALGTMAPPATGLIATELNPPLIGTGTDSKPLSQTQAAAQQLYFSFAGGACTGA
jgi:arylsulfatase A-like enzyme